MIASLRLGGAERQLSGLALMLHAQGHDVEVLTYREGSFYAKPLREAGVKLTVIPHPGNEKRLVEDISAHLRETGCQILISYLVGTNLKACFIKQRCPGLKLVVSERNCNTDKWLYTTLRLKLYKMADAVVCNSYAQEALVRKRCPALDSRLSTIPNFVDAERFSPSGHIPGADGRINVVTTARLYDRKNAIGLIKAVSEAGCDNLYFDWYGALSNDKYYGRCQKLIRKLGLQDRIHIHPGCENVEELYVKADAFCLPSFYEGTSNALAEALACGLPAICSDVSDNARYIFPGENGLLFDPCDTGDFAKALRKLSATSSEELAKWGRKSREIAEKKLTKEVFIKRYSELLEGLSGGKNGGC
ncbi:MAG: glycosyltransferase family 4 protein [Bacteroidales bacterium]|nr:glycosyltransferase family 4 protein [Bacteroidales bacterium]